MKRSVMSRHLTARLGLVCGLAAPLLATPALAEEGMFFKDMLGTIGIIPKSKDAIPYRDRAPLVVPPKTQLRTPGAASAAANPAWPNDPDVAARRRAAADDALPATWSEKRRASEERSLRLTPAEIQAGRVASHEQSVPGSHRGDSARDVLYLSPDQLRATARKDEADTGPEPTRRALTDPPSGMRRPTNRNVAAASTPTIDQQRLDANPMTWLTRRFKSEDDD